MIINNRYRFIYLHVPKTAGTTVSTVLHEYSGPVDLDLGGVLNDTAHDLNELWSERWGLEKHSSARKAKDVLGEKLWNDYFKFAFVRNPFAKTYSAYKFHKLHKAFDSILDTMTFGEYLRSDLFKELKLLGARSQREFLAPIKDIDFIGRQEELSRDLAFIRSMIEKRPIRPAALNQLNRTSKGDEWKSMTESDMDIIREVLEADFKAFGYSLDDGSIVRGLNNKVKSY